MAPTAGRREVPCFAFKGEARQREGGAAPASGPGDARARGCLVNGRNSDASRTRQAIVTIDEPRPMLRPRWFVRLPHCGLGKVRAETHHYQSKPRT